MPAWSSAEGDEGPGSVARCAASEAAVHVTSVVSPAGATLETEVVRHLDAALGLLVALG